jgi:CheY-like chemotaxis protein
MPDLSKQATAVLLVDDDSLVRETCVALLRDLGCTVFSTWSGEEALGLVQRHASIETLISDLLIPGIDGLQLVAAARQIRPSLRCFLTSGYATGVTDPDVQFVPKPLGRAKLAMMVMRAPASALPTAE